MDADRHPSSPHTSTPADAQRTVGQRIRRRRQALGWSQQALASRAQLHRTYVTSVESGARNLSLLNMLRLAFELGLDPGELVEGIQLPSSVLRGCGARNNHESAAEPEPEPASARRSGVTSRLLP